MGRAALRFVIDNASQRGIPGTIYKRQVESTAFQMQISEASLKFETASLKTDWAITIIDSAALTGSQLDPLLRARIRAIGAFATKKISEAVDILLDAHGPASFLESNSLQHIWRDISVVARHIALLPSVGTEVYGKALLGQNENIATII